jgi:hypothetical protein
MKFQKNFHVLHILTLQPSPVHQQAIEESHTEDVPKLNVIITNNDMMFIYKILTPNIIHNGETGFFLSEKRQGCPVLSLYSTLY